MQTTIHQRLQMEVFAAVAVFLSSHVDFAQQDMNSGARFRSWDLWVMSPTRWPLRHSAAETSLGHGQEEAAAREWDPRAGHRFTTHLCAGGTRRMQTAM